MKTSRNSLLFLLIVCLFTSCNSGENKSTEASIEYELVQKADKKFTLDYETAFDEIDAQYVIIDEIGYYTFFNRKNMSLYFYNYETGELTHQVKLAEDGPNKIELPYYYFEYWVHDFDNIFINTIAFQYRINKKGEVLKRVVEKNDDFFTKKSLSLDQSTTFSEGKLFTSVNTLVPQEGDTSWKRAIFDFENETFLDEYVDERILVDNYDEKAERLIEMSKSGGVSTLPVEFAGDHQALFGTSPINDSLYLFEKTVYQGAFYAGDPNIEVTDLDGFFNKTKRENLEGGGIRIGPKMIQPKYFTALLQSANKEFIYRILIHGTKARFNQETEKEEPELIGASLIIFNTKTKKSSSVLLPHKELEMNYYPSGVFVSNDGIHFPKKNEEKENEKSYYLIDVSMQ